MSTPDWTAQARQLHRQINSEACEWPTTCNTCEAIAAALAAAYQQGREEHAVSGRGLRPSAPTPGEEKA